MDEASAEITRNVVTLVVVGVGSFVAFGYHWVRSEMPFLRAPRPQQTVPSGYGTLECVVVGAATECTSPITRVPCIAWQLNRLRDESAEFTRFRATGDWPDWIRVRLASGEEVTLELPATLLGVDGKHRKEGSLPSEWFARTGRKGGDCNSLSGDAEQEAVVFAGDRLFIVGTFARIAEAGDPMRRDTIEPDGDAGSSVRIVIPPKHSRGRLAAVLHGGEYDELGWRGTKAWLWFFSPWQIWLIAYLCYVFFVHLPVCGFRSDEREPGGATGAATLPLDPSEL